MDVSAPIAVDISFLYRTTLVSASEKITWVYHWSKLSLHFLCINGYTLFAGDALTQQVVQQCDLPTPQQKPTFSEFDSCSKVHKKEKKDTNPLPASYAYLLTCHSMQASVCPQYL